MSRDLIYPRQVPNAPSSTDGLGNYFSGGGEYPTDSIDYIKFSEFAVKYEGGGGLSSVGTPPKRDPLQSCYLYIPQNLSTDYGVQYNQVNMGALGIEAASVINSKTDSEITQALQAASSSGTPEAVFNSINTGIGAANNLFGLSGSPGASGLSALGQGLAFNPFMEQVFEGVGFRNHNFSFKMIARNPTEAKEISDIVKFFKMAMLPEVSGGPATGPGTTGSTAAGAPAAFPGRTNQSRYLKVPNRFEISFKRKKGSVSTGSTATISSADITDIVGLYQFKECALTNVQVSYTPDGQYVTTEDTYVPAIQMDLRFVELSIITKQDLIKGYY